MGSSSSTSRRRRLAVLNIVGASDSAVEEGDMPVSEGAHGMAGCTISSREAVGGIDCEVGLGDPLDRPLRVSSRDIVSLVAS